VDGLAIFRRKTYSRGERGALSGRKSVPVPAGGAGQPGAVKEAALGRGGPKGGILTPPPYAEGGRSAAKGGRGFRERNLYIPKKNLTSF